MVLTRILLLECGSYLPVFSKKLNEEAGERKLSCPNLIKNLPFFLNLKQEPDAGGGSFTSFLIWPNLAEQFGRYRILYTLPDYWETNHHASAVGN